LTLFGKIAAIAITDRLHGDQWVERYCLGDQWVQCVAMVAWTSTRHDTMLLATQPQSEVDERRWRIVEYNHKVKWVNIKSVSGSHYIGPIAT